MRIKVNLSGRRKSNDVAHRKVDPAFTCDCNMWIAHNRRQLCEPTKKRRWPLTCTYVDQVRTVYDVEVRKKSYRTVDGATSPIRCLCPFNANMLAGKAGNPLKLHYVCMHAA